MSRHCNINFYPAALGMVAAGVFLDFYIWELNSEMVFIDSTALSGDRTAFRYLLDNNGYTLQKILHYSFGMHLGGTYESRTEREGEERINLRPSIFCF